MVQYLEKYYFCTGFVMRKKVHIGMVAVVALIAMLTGCKKKEAPLSPLVGHWGCEQYVSCRTDSLGVEQWDTLRFEAVAGGGCGEKPNPYPLHDWEDDCEHQQDYGWDSMWHGECLMCI